MYSMETEEPVRQLALEIIQKKKNWRANSQRIHSSIYPRRVEGWRWIIYQAERNLLGYALPNNLISGVRDIQVTLTGRNLLSFDSYDGYDQKPTHEVFPTRLRVLTLVTLPIHAPCNFHQGKFFDSHIEMKKMKTIINNLFLILEPGALLWTSCTKDEYSAARPLLNRW